MSAQAAGQTNCGGGGQTNRLDPPSNPAGDLASGMIFGTTPLTGVHGSKNDATTVYASWDRWNPGNVGAIETYFLYASSDGGTTWSCTRSYALSAQITGVTPGVEIQVFVLASKGDTWARSQLIKVPPVNPPTILCAPKTYELMIKYIQNLKAFSLYMSTGSTSGDPNSKNYSADHWQAQYLDYTFEATVDNWKSKVIGKDSLGSKTFSLGETVFIRPLDSKKMHTFRATPVSPEFLRVSTSGCSPLIKSLLPIEQKADPCSISVLDPNCKQEVVAGENAGSDTAVHPTSKPKVTVITCVKGKLSKKVTAVKPVCPSGYKKKA